MTWTHFHDMHGGGSQKLEWGHIYIEAPQDEAEAVFYNRFGRNPHRVTCTCCGPDYSLDEWPNLKVATGHERNCRKLKTPKDEDGRYMNGLPELRENYYLEPDEEPPEGFEVDDRWLKYGDHIPLEDYIQQDDVLVINADEIGDEERKASIPEEGYVWVEG